MKLKQKKRKRKMRQVSLSECSRCGAIATDQDQLCKPQRFQGSEECSIPEKEFNRFPMHGNCQSRNYSCSKCGREALAREYLCEAEPV
jgi:hypothetical protein